MSTPQQRGRDYEDEFADRHGWKRVPGSGAGHRYKLDVGAIEVLASLKHTEAESFRITAEDLREMLAGAGGPGSRGQLGIMLTRISGIGEEIASLRWSDLLAILRGDVQLEIRPNGREIKQAAADPLAYLKGETQ